MAKSQNESKFFHTIIQSFCFCCHKILAKFKSWKVVKTASQQVILFSWWMTCSISWIQKVNLVNVPINNDNFWDIDKVIQDSLQTLKSLKDTNGLPVIQGPRKTFVIGFCISAQSILEISKTLLEREESPFEYVLTYRFSQDALEMYFSKIRSRFGWNNNPTALQFKYALWSLLLKNRIESPNTANCLPVSEQETNTVSSGKVDPAVSDLLLSSNVWRKDVLHYISGYVVKKLLESIDCPDCAEALYDNSDSTSSGNTMSLLSWKR